MLCVFMQNHVFLLYWIILCFKLCLLLFISYEIFTKSFLFSKFNLHYFSCTIKFLFYPQNRKFVFIALISEIEPENNLVKNEIFSLICLNSLLFLSSYLVSAHHFWLMNISCVLFLFFSTLFCHIYSLLYCECILHNCLSKN